MQLYQKLGPQWRQHHEILYDCKVKYGQYGNDKLFVPGKDSFLHDVNKFAAANINEALGYGPFLFFNVKRIDWINNNQVMTTYVGRGEFVSNYGVELESMWLGLELPLP